MARALLAAGSEPSSALLDPRIATQMLRHRELSAEQLVASTLGRIERVNPTVNAFVSVLDDRAHEQAQAIDARIAAGQWPGPLTGMTFAVKDVMHVAGQPTRAGSGSLTGFVAGSDARCIERLQGAGAILVGKVHTHELAAGATSTSALYGQARNPWNVECIPGGSSGGSAIAVAAGLVHAALGTDTGGSVRIPAAFCGVVGFKGTFGTVSRSGVLPRSWTLDTVGVLSRGVRDTARVFDAIAGHDADDAYSSERIAGGTAGRLTADLRGIRAGILDGDYFTLDRDPEIGSAFESAIATLTALGVRMTRVRFELASAAHAAAMLITLAEADSTQDEAIRATPEAYGDDVRGQLHLGEFISARQYRRSLRIRSRIQGELDELFSRVDVLLTPTTPTFPARIDRMHGSGMVQFAHNTRPFSLVGLPALSIPAGFSTGRLPIGLQVIGRPFDDATVLGVAHGYEQATGWHLQWPPCVGDDV